MMRDQRDMLDELEPSLRIPAQMRAAYVALHRGVDYTQNPISHGGFADGSITPELRTAARDLAKAFEQLDRAYARFKAAGVIPF